jgi:hypothetical protein
MYLNGGFPISVAINIKELIVEKGIKQGDGRESACEVPNHHAIGISPAYDD